MCLGIYYNGNPIVSKCHRIWINWYILWYFHNNIFYDTWNTIHILRHFFYCALSQLYLFRLLKRWNITVSSSSEAYIWNIKKCAIAHCCQWDSEFVVFIFPVYWFLLNSFFFQTLNLSQMNGYFPSKLYFTLG